MAKTRMAPRQEVLKPIIRKQDWKVEVVVGGKRHVYELTCEATYFFDHFPLLGLIDGTELFDAYSDDLLWDRELINEY